ncbi:MAG TPA: hypothetical protein VHE83_10765 [Mycobacteriales bacterium]|nr:hypothetical protein [Mycobacteriales bacterium]
MLVLVGYLVASGTTREADQLIGVDIGFGALLVSGGTGVAWLTAGHRCLRARQRRVLAKVGVLDALKAVGATASDPVVATLAAERLVAVRDATYFHRHSCDLARDKVVVSASRREHEQAGRVPCGICGP